MPRNFVALVAVGLALAASVRSQTLATQPRVYNLSQINPQYNPQAAGSINTFDNQTSQALIDNFAKSLKANNVPAGALYAKRGNQVLLASFGNQSLEANDSAPFRLGELNDARSNIARC